MRRNITIALDEETARWLRVEAAKQERSMSAFLGEIIEERRRQAEGYEAARVRFMSREPRPLRHQGAPLPSRAAVHERRSPAPETSDPESP